MVVGLIAEERSRTDPGFVGHEAKNWPPVVFRSAAHKRWVSRGSSGTGGLARGAGGKSTRARWAPLSPHAQISGSQPGRHHLAHVNCFHCE